MTQPHPRGHFLSLITATGDTCGYIVAPGQEQAAMRAVLKDRRHRRLTDHEAGRLLCGLNQLIEKPAAGPRAFSTPAGLREKMLALAVAGRRLVRRAIEGLVVAMTRGRDESGCFRGCVLHKEDVEVLSEASE